MAAHNLLSIALSRTALRRSMPQTWRHIPWSWSLSHQSMALTHDTGNYIAQWCKSLPGGRSQGFQPTCTIPGFSKFLRPWWLQRFLVANLIGTGWWIGLLPLAKWQQAMPAYDWRSPFLAPGDVSWSSTITSARPHGLIIASVHYYPCTPDHFKHR